MPAQFYPVSLNKAANEVVDQINFVIRSGAVATGARLPQIDELSELMQVSKPVIGEALRILSDAGIVETKRGLGGGVVVVRDEIPVRLINRSPFWQRFRLSELVAARRPIETQIALLAAERATPEDFEDMRLQIDLLQEVSPRQSRQAHPPRPPVPLFDGAGGAQRAAQPLSARDPGTALRPGEGILRSI